MSKAKRTIKQQAQDNEARPKVKRHKLPDLPSYRHTPEMGEISGVGGKLEEACQAMLDAGVKWLQRNPNAHIVFRRFPRAYGFDLEVGLSLDSADAKDLAQTVCRVCPGGIPPGSIVDVVVLRVEAIQRIGWDAYVEAVIRYREEEDSRSKAKQLF